MSPAMLLGFDLGQFAFGCGLLVFAAPFWWLFVYALRGGKATDFVRVPNRNLHPWRFWLGLAGLGIVLFEMTYGGGFLVYDAFQK